MFLKKIAQISLAIIFLASLVDTPPAAQASTTQASSAPSVTVIRPSRSGRSTPLSSLAATNPGAPENPGNQPAQQVPLLLVPHHASGSSAAPATSASVLEAPVQTDAGTAGMPLPIVNIEGVGNLDHVLPPDPNGDIGIDPATNRKYYFQWVNTHFQIWDVTNPASPSVAAGPTAGNAIWSALGSGDICARNNQGDPVVVFDTLSKRWLLSQFAYTQVGNIQSNGHQCLAVSTSGDPTGAYYVYDFAWGSGQFNDYPKFGVWRDAYYATANQFVNSGWAGAGVAAFNKVKLLTGDPSAEMLYINLFSIDTNFGSILPATFTG